MQEIFIGEAIRQRRLALGLTQEELCEGLCEPATLSRIENGRQAPSRSRANALLQRLGLPNDRYYVILTPKEAEADSLRESSIPALTNLNGRWGMINFKRREQRWMD